MDTRVADPLIGELLDGRYRIRGRIARGGMATVYHATDERLERTVAIKVIRPGYASQGQFLARFEREGRTIARLAHANVVAVYDQGTHDLGDPAAGQPVPYLVMEYVRGRTLRDLLAQRGRFGPAEALAVLEPMLAGLAAAHRAGLVHRDVKPENVLVGADGTVKVADFGLSRAVAASADSREQLVATVAYVAPELVTGGTATPRADVYSAGIVMFEMLVGQVPYDSPDTAAVAYQHVENAVPAPSRFVPRVGGQLDDLVRWATERDPARRPADAGTLLAAVRRVRGALDAGDTLVPVAAGPLPTAGPAQPTAMLPGGALRPPVATGQRPPSRAGLAIGAALLVLGLVVAVAGWWIGAGRYTDTPNLAGMNQEGAERTARGSGLSIRWAAPEYSDTVPVDRVARQLPAAGDRVVRGGRLTLAMSRGPLAVPDLVGQPKDDVLRALRELGLKPQAVDEYSQSHAAGRVTRIDPAPGNRVPPGSAVTVGVSKGKPPVVVPNVIGKRTDDATRDLERLSLTWVVEEVDGTPGQDAGRVLEQSPTGGTGVDKGAKVTLKVSKGPARVPVPRVEGMRFGEAERVLKEAGFKVQRIGPRNGTVREQYPGPQELAEPGSTVQVYVL